MEIRKELFYTKANIWVRFNDNGTATVGITPYGKELFKKINFINLCDEGETFSAYDIFGDVVTCCKGVFDLYAPIDGTVSCVNDELLDEPEKINDDPYGEWLVEFYNVRKTQRLLTAEEYEKFIK
ncbi:MAG: glycine cleavage system protein H [Clostridia bacterium]|nr:glycine cleavage system protein H [Clostridia bacterium]